jgi:hypothetical protein
MSKIDLAVEAISAKFEMFDNSLNEIKDEITKMEEQINTPTTIKCDHLICPSCQAAIEAELKVKEIMQLQLNEKKQLFERIKDYGNNK